MQGYRTQGLPDEVGRAEYTLRAAGIAVELQGNAGEVGAALGPEQEAVLSLALRATTTNVVRHSRAYKCEIRLERSERGVCATATNGREALVTVAASEPDVLVTDAPREEVARLRSR